MGSPSSPTANPDQGHLESLDDLLKKKKLEEHSASSSQTPNDPFQSQELEGNDSMIVHTDEPSSSSITITPKSPDRSVRPRDESRWNGFHLWRTESYNLRAARERANAEARELRERQGWVKAIEDDIKQFYARLFGSSSAPKADEEALQEEGMSRGKMFLLTLVLAGSQLAWCLEFGYGTPYLLSLGLSKASTSLVWFAAPASGLMQPLIGVLSDLSTSRFRRRQYIIAAVSVLIISTLSLAFSLPTATAIVDMLHTGLADWDPARQEALKNIHQFVAVISFIIFDMSINSLQAASRTLILDAVPSFQHSRANAWHGRMTHAGNVAGYAAGWYDLSSSSLLSWLQGDQFRRYAVLSVFGVAICTITTCVSIKEQAREPVEGPGAVGFVAKVKEALYNIYQSIRRLPRPVRRICLVQLFAFMGWFPFLFYATEWVIEIRQKEKGTPSLGDVDDEAAEKGSLALLMFALMALFAGTVLPFLSLSNSSKDRSIQLSGPEDEHLPDELQDSSTSHAKPRNKSWRLTLRTIWTLSLILYSIQAAVLTFAVQTTVQAIVLIASIGIPWAVASWVPFALVMESVREAEDGSSPFEFEADWFAPERVRGRREVSSAFTRARVARAIEDCEPLPTSSSSESQPPPPPPSTFLARGTEVVGDNSQSQNRQASRQVSAGVPVPLTNQNAKEDGAVESLGGTVLGIHNIAIILPQLVVALVASIILRTKVNDDHSGGSNNGGFESSENGVSVVWVIRLGGVAAIFAAILTRFVPLTRTERQMRGYNDDSAGVAAAEPRYDDEASEEEGEE